jgi:hypothetical protein
MSIILSIIQLGTFRNAFHKATEIAIVGPNFENARKAFDKNTFQCHFLGGKPKGP